MHEVVALRLDDTSMRSSVTRNRYMNNLWVAVVLSMPPIWPLPQMKKNRSRKVWLYAKNELLFERPGRGV